MKSEVPATHGCTVHGTNDVEVQDKLTCLYHKQTGSELSKISYDIYQEKIV